MINNHELKLHFIDVGHGDATIIEFPDYGSKAHFAVVDFGAETKDRRKYITEYMNNLVKFRKENDQQLDYVIDFVCVTHPHEDHYGGLREFFKKYANENSAEQNRIKAFWDCGFRTNSVSYNKVLLDISKNHNIIFTRVSAGSEFNFGEIMVTVLAPSIDLRNRFDTYGVDKNNASIVLKIKFKDSYIILAGDAQFPSWGKITEEFPRERRITFFKDALGLSKRRETSDQLKCNLLRTSHHGSKHGTSLEYLERMNPKYLVISAGDANYYDQISRYKKGDFPHSLVIETFKVLDSGINIFTTGEKGNIIFKYAGGYDKRDEKCISDSPATQEFVQDLRKYWS